MSPEAAAREKIDDFLFAAGWAIHDYKAFNSGAARGIALWEFPLDSGRCDYLLLVDRIPLGVIEAKKEGTTLSTVAGERVLGNDGNRGLSRKAVRLGPADAVEEQVHRAEARDAVDELDAVEDLEAALEQFREAAVKTARLHGAPIVYLQDGELVRERP